MAPKGSPLIAGIPFSVENHKASPKIKVSVAKVRTYLIKLGESWSMTSVRLDGVSFDRRGVIRMLMNIAVPSQPTAEKM